MAEPVTANQSVITCVFTGAALPYGAVTTLACRTPPGGWEDDLTTLPELGVAFGNLHQYLSTSEVRLLELRVKVGPSASGPTLTTAVSRPGALSNKPTAPNNSWLIRKLVPGVSGRYAGRMYWPGVSEDQVDGAGNIPGSMVEGTNLQLADLYGVMVDLGCPPIVLSGTSDDREVGSMRLESRIATQRRRMRR